MELDQQVVNMAKAIRQKESGGDFGAKGKSGEMGGYQFTPDTWDGIAPKYGIKVPLEQATPEQQNAVAYNRIKEWKDSGKDVTQIASMWNAGEGEPDAYTGKFGSTTPTHKAGDPSVGVNSFGAKYDVPGYAKGVANEYLKLKGQTVSNVEKVPVPETSAASMGVQTPKEGLGTKLRKGLLSLTGGDKIAESVAASMVRDRGLKYGFGAEANYSQLTPEAKAKLEAKGVPTSAEAQRKETAGQITAPTGKELAIDIGKLGLTIAGLVATGAASVALKGPKLMSQAATIAESSTGIPVKVFGTLSKVEQFNTLAKAASAASPAEKLVLTDALAKLTPGVRAALGASKFAKDYPWIAEGLKIVGKTPGTLYKGVKMVAKVAPSIGLGTVTGMSLYDRLTGKDTSK